MDTVIGKRGIEITGDSSKSKDIVLSEDVKYVIDRAFALAREAGHICRYRASNVSPSRGEI